MQGFFFLAFVIPSTILLIKKWEHMDTYSRVMIILYIFNMSIKIAFYIFELFIPPINTPEETMNLNVILKSFTRTMIFLINSLFLLSLHVFVQKL